MIPGTCIEIRTRKFPILDGEKEEIVNEGIFGRAICIYLKERLLAKGLKVPFFCAEDWGWWLEVEDGDFKMGLCIYSDPDFQDFPQRYAIMSSLDSGKKWSWSKFRFIDISDQILKIFATVENIFCEDPEIESVRRHEDAVSARVFSEG